MERLDECAFRYSRPISGRAGMTEKFNNIKDQLVEGILDAALPGRQRRREETERKAKAGLEKTGIMAFIFGKKK